MSPTRAGPCSPCCALLYLAHNSTSSISQEAFALRMYEWKFLGGVHVKRCRQKVCKGTWVRDPGRGNCVQPFTRMQMIRKGPCDGSERNKGSDIRGGHRQGHRPQEFGFQDEPWETCPSYKLLVLFEALFQLGMRKWLPVVAEYENCICTEARGLRICTLEFFICLYPVT